eukprot:SAG31_NODE_31384_length_368_cov_130.925651_1_plen_26_part_01
MLNDTLSNLRQGADRGLVKKGKRGRG